MALTRPAPGQWRYEDLFDLPDDGRRWEIIEGTLYEMPGPTPDQATAIRNLIALLLPYFVAMKLEWFTAPVDIFFPGADPVQPDLLAFVPGGRVRRTKRGFEGPPDFVVEVVSPSNRGHDRLTKRALYARAGVREYWLVDPEARTIEVLVLDGDVLRLLVVASGEEPVASTVLPSAAFAAAAVFAGVGEADGEDQAAGEPDPASSHSHSS